MPWKRKWQPTPVFWLRESHEQRSLAGCSPGGCKSQTWFSNKSTAMRKVTSLACHLHMCFSLKTAVTFVGSRIALCIPRILKDIHSRVKLNKIIFNVSSKTFLSVFFLFVCLFVLNWEFSAVESMTSASTVDAWPWSELRCSSLPTVVCASSAPASTQQTRQMHPWIIMKVILA